MLFVFVALAFYYFLIFGYLSKTSLRNLEIAKKIKNAEKKDILTRTVSTGVLTTSVLFVFGISSKFAFFGENTIKIGVSAKTQQKTNNAVLKTCPSMLHNKLGPVFNTTFGPFVCCA